MLKPRRKVKLGDGSRRQVDGWSSNEGEVRSRPLRKLFCWRSYDPDETCTTNYNDEGRAEKRKALLEEYTNGPRKNRTNDISPQVFAAAKSRAVRKVRKLNGVSKPECSREEAIKRWVEKLKVGTEDKAVTRLLSEQSLEYYNENNFTNFVLVDPRISNMIDLYDGRDVIHVNFRAKKPNDDDRDAFLFFAELEHGQPCSVTSCIILDSNIEVQKFCRGCHPGSEIQHPVNGFEAKCRGLYRDISSETEQLFYGIKDFELDG